MFLHSLGLVIVGSYYFSFFMCDRENLKYRLTKFTNCGYSFQNIYCHIKADLNNSLGLPVWPNLNLVPGKSLREVKAASVILTTSPTSWWIVYEKMGLAPKENTKTSTNITSSMERLNMARPHSLQGRKEGRSVQAATNQKEALQMLKRGIWLKQEFTQT